VACGVQQAFFANALPRRNSSLPAEMQTCRPEMVLDSPRLQCIPPSSRIIPHPASSRSSQPVPESCDARMEYIVIYTIHIHIHTNTAGTRAGRHLPIWLVDEITNAQAHAYHQTYTVYTVCMISRYRYHISIGVPYRIFAMGLRR
jgi:hypothetical protein